MTRMLVVYYSYSSGNTEKIALKLAKYKNADICGIDPVTPYPEDYEETVALAKQQVEQNIEVPILQTKYDPKDYDVIAIGTPTWWYTMAPVVKTFLMQHDFTNKTVIPFMTNAGWPGSVIADMQKYAKGAMIKHPKEILFDEEGGCDMKTSCKEVNDWIVSI